MYCPTCGSKQRRWRKVLQGLWRESHAAKRLEGQPPHVPNHLVWAILVTIFCCLPFGIVSIVYAAQVNTKLSAGDIDGARLASQNAKTWAWVAFGVGITSSFAGVLSWLLFGVATVVSA